MLAPDPGTMPALIGLADAASRLSGELDTLRGHVLGLQVLQDRVEREYSNSTSNQLESSRIVKSGAGRLFGFSGTNTSASPQFILGFDRTGIPANGAVPQFVMTAEESSDFWASWTPYWRNFRDGWVFCNSSTAATLTLGSADCWFDAQYL